MKTSFVPSVLAALCLFWVNAPYARAASVEGLSGSYRLVATAAGHCPASLRIAARLQGGRLRFRVAEPRGTEEIVLGSDRDECEVRTYGQDHLSSPHSRVKYGLTPREGAPFLSYACHAGLTTGGDGYVSALLERARFKFAATQSLDGQRLAWVQAYSGFQLLSFADATTRLVETWDHRSECEYERAASAL